MRPSPVLAALLVVSLAGCERKVEPAPQASSPAATPAPLASAPSAAKAPPLSERLTRPTPERLVAIGDLHGDLEATRAVLRLAGAIDANDAWIGGKLVVVQTGDCLDRGDGERAILDLTERLQVEAKKAGGDVVLLSGNHELMNVAFDFRYVTPGGFSAFHDVKPASPSAASLVSQLPDTRQGRAAAFAPGGPYAMLLARRPIVMKVGDSVFVHGGFLPKHVTYGLDRMVDEVAAWMRAEKSAPPAIVVAEDGPVWTRAYSMNPGPAECGALTDVLATLGAKRMVVGHTVQQGGANSACDGKVWRIDVGISKYYGGTIQALEITKDGVRVLKP